MQLLNAVRIAGNTARLVETRFFNIVNGAVCDKTNYSPRTLQFVENIIQPLLPVSQGSSFTLDGQEDDPLM